jgi:precorrin-2 C20-methyltransferase/precorrin-3B C17-methyltransferase
MSTPTSSDPRDDARPAVPATRVGRLLGVGVGPGDPELLTLKAIRVIREAHVVAYPSARHGQSIARRIAAAHLDQGQIELPMIFPVTVEAPRDSADYEEPIEAFYNDTAADIARHLEAGRDVAVLCEGDPFFYGSFIYLHDRLADRFAVEMVPGITSVSAAAAMLGTPSAHRDETLVVVPGTLAPEEMAERFHAAGPDGAVAVIKLGSNFSKVRNVLEATGSLDRAFYVERASTPAQRIAPVASVDPNTVPYFSLVLVPGSPPNGHTNENTTKTTPATESPAAHQPGSLAIVGLGPGAEEWVSPEASHVLARATDLVGYKTYVDRVPARPGQQRHVTDNREELARARHALELAACGRNVAIVSSGDPGIFAMATAVMEALEAGPAAWRELDVRIVPGISAMQAAAARVGAPLGHDFCVISLSDHLKSWETVTQRLEAAAAADFALALYNPASSERTWQIAGAQVLLLRHRAPTTPVVVARDVGQPSELIRVVDLADLHTVPIDMRTIVLVGTSHTRRFERAAGTAVYTPRSYVAASERPHPEAKRP